MVFPDLGCFDSFLEGKRYCDPQTNTLHKPERFSKNSCSQIGNILCCYYEDNGKKMLGEFREIHPDAEQALLAWYTKTKQAYWERGRNNFPISASHLQAVFGRSLFAKSAK
jgi:hypothetical protein